MSIIDFPNSPSNGDTYSFDGKQWTYDGEKWETSGGSKGQKGEPGPGGGEKGETGAQGATGPTGGKGEKGETGTGAQGPAGISGSDGAKGDKGESGGVGPQGNVGPTGADSTVPGPTGPQGPAGAKGEKGEASTVVGPQGAQGPAGATGPTGATGDKGEPTTGYVDTSTAQSIAGSKTFTADVKFDTGVSEKFSTLTGATGVVTHDCDNGHIFYHTSISADFTANFTNLGLSTNYSTNLTLILNQGATAYIPSAVQIGGSGQTINWQGGSAPTGTVNGIDAVSFTVLEVSGTYVVLGQLVDFT